MAQKKSVKRTSSKKVVRAPKKSYLPTLLIVFVSVLIVLGLLKVRNKRTEMQSLQIQEQMEAQQLIEYPMDTENDGVYTNSQFGFKFKYPEEILKYQAPVTNYLNSDGWLKQEWSPDKYSETYGLYLEIGESYDNKYTYEEAKKLSIDESIGDRDVDYIHRLKPLNNTIPNGIFYYWELDTSTELKRIFYTYSVSWTKGNTVITVGLGSSNKKLLESKYNIFKDVVNSTELLN
jgi:hypothetical protein